MAEFVFEEIEEKNGATVNNPTGGTSTDNPAKPGDDGSGTSSGSSALDFAKCISLQGLYNNGYTYYESSERVGNFKYTLTIKDGMKVVLGKTTGETIREYTLSAGGNKKYRSYEGAELKFGNSENSVPDKYIDFKPAADNNFIRFSLQKK